MSNKIFGQVMFFLF